MGGMDKLAAKTAKGTNEKLAAAEAQLLASTTVSLESLKPRISDKASFDQLVAAVKESTRQNEDIAQLQNRLKTLGSGVLAVAKEAAGLLRPI